LFFFCAGNELFFISLYLIKKWENPPAIGGPFLALAPFAPEAYQALLAGLTWPQLSAILSSWVCLAKNGINVVQLWKASKILVGVDLAERARARLELEMAESKEE
jgi:CDP-diacylglycerol--inositol 3-phosphatidyltransferase